MSTNLLLAFLLGFTGWGTAEPVRSEQRWSPTLNDIEQHIHDGAGIGRAATYRDSDKVTHAHEMSHGVNARYRNAAQQEEGAAYALYVLEGRVFLFPRLPIRISDVAARTPRAWRDSHFQLYMIQMQSYWNNDPIYILDEAVAYLHGAKVGLEYRMLDRTRQSLERAAKSYRFGLVLNDMADNEDVTKFLIWYRKELGKTISNATSNGVQTGTVNAILATVVRKQQPAPETKTTPQPGPSVVPCPGGTCPTCPSF